MTPESKSGCATRLSAVPSRRPLAGMLALAVTRNEASGRRDGTAESLVAHPDFDSGVICGSLLCYAVKFCRQQGCGDLVLAVDEGDRGFSQFLRSIEALDS